MKTNKDKLVMQAVQGKISHPRSGRNPYRLDREGVGNILPGTGGISYNVKVGDPAFGWQGDHIEPGVSMKISESSRTEDNYALCKLACVGNKARVVEGEAKGATGIVTGTHGGIFHVLIDFARDDIAKMKIGDQILVKAYGQGLTLTDYPQIKIFNIDPDLFDKMSIKEKNGKIEVPVTTCIPGHLMGSGIGSSSVSMGDYDITTGNKKDIKKHGIDNLKLGDFVYLENCDNTYGREYIEGAGSIGIVVHSNCIIMGHGPGVTTVLTSKKDKIVPVIDEKANIANYLNLK